MNGSNKSAEVFDGNYGCEELKPGQKPKVSVTLVDDAGNEKLVSVEGLNNFDASEVHKKWKDTYGDRLESKAIFDCD